MFVLEPLNFVYLGRMKIVETMALLVTKKVLEF